MDSIGAIDIISEGFACVGTTGSELTGIAEVLWKKKTWQVILTDQ